MSDETKMSDESKPGSIIDSGRRGFFRSVGGVSVIAAAAVASPFAATEAEAYDPGTEEGRARYRLTDDVKAFYRTNGYETKQK